MLPVLPNSHFIGLLDPWSEAIQTVAENTELASWISEPAIKSTIDGVHFALFERLKSFVRSWEAWAPGLIVRATAPAMADRLAELRIYRDDFDTLRDIYVQTYEVCCKVLPFAIAVLNTEVRGDPNLFGPPPPSIIANNARASSPSSLGAFSELSNATKLLWFNEWQSWSILPRFLDNKVRNSIGHASARHDILSGNVESDNYCISYLDFVAAVLDLSYPLLMMLQVIKSIRLIAADAASDESSQ